MKGRQVEREERLRLLPEAQAVLACGGWLVCNGIGLRLNIDTLLNLDPWVKPEDDGVG